LKELYILKSAKTTFHLPKDFFGRKLHGGEGVTTERIKLLIEDQVFFLPVTCFGSFPTSSSLSD
jgi:hypothetical protein